MKIKAVAGSNFKGATFSHELAPVTLFYGRNFSGKSTRLEAATLALAGWLPGVERMNGQLFARLSSGSAFACSLMFDGGQHVSRTYEQKGGSVKATVVGGEFAKIPDAAVDASEFLTLSAKERVKFLFDRARLPDSFTVDALADQIVANIKNIKVENHAPAHEQAIGEVVDLVSKVDGLGSPQDWLTAVVQQVSEAKKLTTQNAQRMAKTVQGLAQVAQGSVPAPQDAEAKLAKARKALEEAQQAAARLGAEHEAAADMLEAAEEIAQTFVDEDKTRKRLAELEAILKDSEGKVKPPGPEPAMHLTRGNKPDDSQAKSKLAEVERELAKASAATGLAAAEVARVEREIAKAESVKLCPTCRQSVEHLQQVIAAGYKSQLNDANAALDKAQKTEKVADEPVDEARSVLVVVQKAMAAFDDAEAEKHTAYQNSVAEWSQRNAAYTRAMHEVKVMTAQAQELRDKLASNKDAREAKERVPELAKKANELAILVSGSNTVVEANRQAVSVADLAYKRLLAERAHAKSRADAVAELDSAKASDGVLKAACAMLAELQAKLVDQAIGPFLDRCNALCASVLKSPLAYMDGEIGMAKPTGFYSWRSFSGTEECVAFAAIQAALAEGSPVRVVMLDEFDVDAENWPIVLGLLCGMVERGEIDNALVAHTTPPDGFEHPLYHEICMIQ